MILWSEVKLDKQGSLLRRKSEKQSQSDEEKGLIYRFLSLNMTEKTKTMKSKGSSPVPKKSRRESNRIRH